MATEDDSNIWDVRNFLFFKMIVFSKFWNPKKRTALIQKFWLRWSKKSTRNKKKIWLRSVTYTSLRACLAARLWPKSFCRKRLSKSNKMPNVEIVLVVDIGVIKWSTGQWPANARRTAWKLQSVLVWTSMIIESCDSIVRFVWKAVILFDQHQYALAALIAFQWKSFFKS